MVNVSLLFLQWNAFGTVYLISFVTYFIQFCCVCGQLCCKFSGLLVKREEGDQSEEWVSVAVLEVVGTLEEGTLGPRLQTPSLVSQHQHQNEEERKWILKSKILFIQHIYRFQFLFTRVNLKSFHPSRFYRLSMAWWVISKYIYVSITTPTFQLYLIRSNYIQFTLNLISCLERQIATAVLPIFCICKYW